VDCFIFEFHNFKFSEPAPGFKLENKIYKTARLSPLPLKSNIRGKKKAKGIFLNFKSTRR